MSYDTSFIDYILPPLKKQANPPPYKNPNNVNPFQIHNFVIFVNMRMHPMQT